MSNNNNYYNYKHNSTPFSLFFYHTLFTISLLHHLLPPFQLKNPCSFHQNLPFQILDFLGFHAPPTTTPTSYYSLLVVLRHNLANSMVSIRRRKLLGLCSGRSAFLVPLPKFSESGHFAEHRFFNNKPTCIHPMPSTDIDESKEKIAIKVVPGKSNSHASSSLMEQTSQQFPEVKRRKRHRRKHFENQEPCLMRGVYFKNMKWQAAIKVDKKQIHLGTVGTQEEAARLYDRAAFMCGREPNFELSEEEKRELRQFKWDDFLAFTRSAITNKKTRRRSGTGARRKSEPLTSALNSEEDKEEEEEGEPESNGFSASEDIEHDISFS